MGRDDSGPGPGYTQRQDFWRNPQEQARISTADYGGPLSKVQGTTEQGVQHGGDVSALLVQQTQREALPGWL